MKRKTSIALWFGWLAVALMPAHDIVAAERSPVGTPAVAAGAPAAASQEAIKMSVFEVKAEAGAGYRSTQTLSGSSTAAELRDIPSSISVMNRELMDDLMITNIAELSTYFISGEADPANESPIGGGASVRMRGISSGSLRDGVYLPVLLDSHNIDRVEILRGPNGFLYTGAGAGGNPNQVSKRANQKDSQRVSLMFGSYDLYRGEFDINRRISDQLAVRASLAYQKAHGFQNFASRSFRGLFVTGNYRPFRNTNVNLSFDYGDDDSIMAPAMLSEQFSTTDRTGATTALASTTGGATLYPGMGRIYNTVGQRRSTGTNITLSDGKVLPHTLNFKGPDSFNQTHYSALDFAVDQSVGENFSFRLRALRQETRKEARNPLGSSAASVYKDVNPNLPDGTINPNFNQYYTEYVHRVRSFTEPQHYYQISGVYDLKLPFTTQRLIGALHHHDLTPTDRFFAEFVDPASGNFNGTLQSGNTLAAYVANNTVLNQNRFYRRFYIRDGDRAELTGWSAVPGQSVVKRDTVSDGNTGRLFDRLYWNSGGSVGSAGRYFKDRLHTFVGWRSDSFYQTPGRLFFNQITTEEYRVPEQPNTRTRVRGDSLNYGGVLHLTKFLSIYGNYGESLSLNVTAGQAGLTPGSVIPSPKGFGEDYGLRWLFLEGKIESNWTYYSNRRLGGAAIPANVRQDELAVLFSDINPLATDTQNLTADGIEFDTVVNINRNWRLLWNYSSNDLSNTERYPAVMSVRQRARDQNLPTPLTDAFLATVPEGTPSAGFTKVRSNLVANYRFDRGPLNGFLIGASAQYREVTYQGNFDLNRDGVAEELWTPAYTVANLMLGYRVRIMNRWVDFNLNINNILDKDYFRATSLSTGAVGAPRDFRFAMRFDL